MMHYRRDMICCEGELRRNRNRDDNEYYVCSNNCDGMAGSIREGQTRSHSLWPEVIPLSGRGAAGVSGRV